MPDFCDISSAAADTHLQASLSRLPPVPTPVANPATECIECFGPLPPARAALGYMVCVECAETAEHAARHFASCGHGAH